MISTEKQSALLLLIGKNLERDVELYAVGGTAMMFHGYKDVTLDIDFVFDDDESKSAFTKAIKSIGYRPLDSVTVYGTVSNRPFMYTLGEERFDLFGLHVVHFIFSPGMKSRATQVHKFEKLTVKVANPHDILIMKCATDRTKDKEDVKNILSRVDIDWNTILDEVRTQIDLGIKEAAFELGEFLEALRNNLGVSIPDEVLKKLWDIVLQQIDQKS